MEAAKAFPSLSLTPLLYTQIKNRDIGIEIKKGFLPWEEGVLPHVAYMGTCCWTGYSLYDRCC